MRSPPYLIGLFFGAAAALTLLPGCGGGGDGAPRTHPVSGKVVFKGKPGNFRQLVGGKVRFQSTSDPSLIAVGTIEDDGTFALGTPFKEKGLGGVPAGTYKARVELPATDNEDTPQRLPFHPKYLDFHKSGLTFTVPVTGEILIEVERPGR
jgi:hypothetical protein